MLVTRLATTESNPEARISALKADGSLYAKLFLAELKIGSESFAEALQYYNEILQSNPNMAQAYFGKGLAFHLGNKPKQALAEYQQALKLKPENRRFRLNFATALADAEQYQQAERALRDLLNADGNVVLAYAELIEVLVKLGKTDEARGIAKQVQLELMTDPEIKNDTLNAIDWFVMQKGKPEQASKPAYLRNWTEKQVYLEQYIFELVR